MKNNHYVTNKYLKKCNYKVCLQQNVFVKHKIFSKRTVIHKKITEYKIKNNEINFNLSL